tara:strand:- start:25290 stop:26606 length:1317 start_codon:yes stop_codon:yes gene_type:complete
MENRKIFVVDTSVLLYDKDCLDKLVGNDIYIPLIVLEELDRFKDKAGILGESARYINRKLDSYRDIGNLHSGVLVEEYNIFVKVWVENYTDSKILSISKTNDNIIISCLEDIANKNPERKVILITKDINLRVKCDALKLNANDYFADYENIDTDYERSSVEEIFLEEGKISQLYKEGNVSVSREDFKEIRAENQFLIAKPHTNNGSSLCYYANEKIHLLDNKDAIKKKSTVDPKNKEQHFALQMILSDSVPLVTITGLPGSGKTYLSLMSALNLVAGKDSIYKRIIFTRPIQAVGKDLGFLPGDINDKMAPWLNPIVDNFRNAFGDLSYFDMMKERGIFDVAPLSFMRGRSFNDSYIIVDEAQNATIHELKTIVTRVGQNSKILLLGDTDQIDAPYLDMKSNGLTQVIEKMKDSIYTTHINLPKGYRSDLASDAAKLL